MNREKINDFIEVYSQELGLANEIKENLKELISNLVLKYQNATQTIDIKKDTNSRYIINPQNEDYSLEDFFLNRLFNNVINVNIAENLRDKSKGHYISKEKKVELSTNALKNQIDSRLIDSFKEDYEVIQNLARKKVINHEFEHGLQSQFSDGKIKPAMFNRYVNFIRNLKEYKNGKYAEQIINEQNIYTNDIDTEYRISGGFANSEKRGRKECLTEIFNESESLDVSNCKKQMDIMFKSGNKIPIYNTESSNYLITNYAYMLKALLGEELTFDSMYFDPDKTERVFEERYGDIIEDTYKEDYMSVRGSKLTVMQLLECVLSDIRNSKIESKQLKLNLVLAKCLERNIEIGKKIYTKQDLKEQVDVFKKYMIFNEDKIKNSLIRAYKNNRYIRKRYRTNNKC